MQNLLAGDGGALGECRVEALDQFAIRLEPAQDRGPIAAHLLGLGDRHTHLRLERGRTPVPEKLLAPCEIEQGGRVTSQRCPRQAKRAPTPIRERACGLMAARACALTVAGEPRVREEPRT